MSPSFTVYEPGTSLDWDSDTKVYFKFFAKKDSIICCVPNHIVIRGNEKADSAAKSVLNLPCVKVGVPNTDFKHLINQYILSTWQDD